MARITTPGLVMEAMEVMEGGPGGGPPDAGAGAAGGVPVAAAAEKAACWRKRSSLVETEVQCVLQPRMPVHLPLCPVRRTICSGLLPGPRLLQLLQKA